MRRINFGIIIFSISIISCLKQQSIYGSNAASDSNPKSYNSALNAESQSSVAASYKLVKLDGSTPIDGSENKVLVCSPKFEYCTETCIAAYVPTAERWSVFKTDYLNGGRCVAYAIAYPNGQSIPRMKYWLGNYIQNSGQVTGSCIVNKENPDLEGKGYFSFIRPENSSSYYLHSFFDSSENLTGSVHLLNFLPPTMWTYHDDTVTNADITPQLMSGFSCIKESEITNAF